MTASNYQIRVCENPGCGLRYPLVEKHPFGERCPLCLGPTRVALMRYISPEPFPPLNQAGTPRTRTEALLDNVRSAWNVGAIFRTADGLGIQKLYLCGITPTPDNESVRKTALGAENSVAWEMTRNALQTAERLKAEGYLLVALEQDARAVSIAQTNWRADNQADKPIVLIVGNEITGVDPDLLDLCERIVHIPMRGGKRSLNVEVAFGVAAFALGSLSGG